MATRSPPTHSRVRSEQPIGACLRVVLVPPQPRWKNSGPNDCRACSRHRVLRTFGSAERSSRWSWTHRVDTFQRLAGDCVAPASNVAYCFVHWETCSTRCPLSAHRVAPWNKSRMLLSLQSKGCRQKYEWQKDVA